MRELDLTIHNATGLHARPARTFVDISKRYQSTIRVRYGSKQVNAKSLIAMLTLGVPHGKTIQVEISGEDEDAAATALAEGVRDGLGEGPADHAAPAMAAEPARPPDTADVPASTGSLIRGVAGAPGIAIGPVFHYTRRQIAVNETFAGVQPEQQRLAGALVEARKQILALHDHLLQHANPTEAAIFAVHRDILADPELTDAAYGAIADGQSAAAAWQHCIDNHAAALAALPDRTLAERASDVRDVGGRVLGLLTGAEDQTPVLPDTPVIVVAYDLTPSETASFDPARVLGFCTAVGGPNAHTAILARALGLPAVVSAGPHVLTIPAGREIVLDGIAGTLETEPDQAMLTQARERQRRERQQQEDAASRATEPALTTDGHRVEIAANIGGLEDARSAAATGAEGVGLLRTEFLFLERSTAPTEDEQFEVYRGIAEALNPHPVIVRTLDIGGDKPLPYLSLPAEENPFLGERGIRLCLAHPALLREQLRAILRAAPAGNLRIMFPMIADATELRQARAVIEELRVELGAPAVQIGIMVEIPSAALMADLLADEVDFFSIGTNDLTQYTLAMDRTHPTLATRADGLHPAVLRLIARTAEAAHRAGKWVGVCGELGADPVAVPILVGLGVDELSVSVPAIPLVKAQIRTLSLAECQQRAQAALGCATARQVREGATP